ncbi:substrate-binding periplasmic protein [Chitinimonas sp.]|uniref:substrate-binding periplasmic protein n=1 Tax=Chitinimonas sp. TaxID=1934313 RepID=UPI0035B1323A
MLSPTAIGKSLRPVDPPCNTGRKVWLAGLLLAAAAATAGETQLRLASDDWCPFVCSDGKAVRDGYLVELTQLALSRSGYRTQPLLLPFNRAINDTVQGKIEGVYAPPRDARLLISHALGESRACFYTRRSSNWQYQGLKSLESVKLGVIADYGYDDASGDAYIADHARDERRIAISYGEVAGVDNLRKLNAGFYPVMLEHEAVVERLAKKLGMDGAIRQAGCLEQAIPLTIGFSRQHAQASIWANALIQGFRELDPALIKALQAKYGIQPAP